MILDPGGVECLWKRCKEGVDAGSIAHEYTVGVNPQYQAESPERSEGTLTNNFRILQQSFAFHV